MKIVLCSDAHVDARCCGVERFDELRKAFNQVCEYAIEKEADAVGFVGDLADGDDARDVLRATWLAADVAWRLHEARIVSLWIEGNHGVFGDPATTVLSPLAALMPMGVCRVAAFAPMLHAEGVGADMLMLPYSPAPYPAGAFIETSPHLQDRRIPLIVMSHLMLPNMHPGSESGAWARGRDRLFPLREVFQLRKKRPVVVVNGHYHRAQEVEREGVPVVVPGAMARLEFDEADHEPSFLFVNATTNGVAHHRVPFANAGRLATIGPDHGWWRHGEIEELLDVFVRIDPPPGTSPEEVARAERMAREQGARAVKVVRPEQGAVVTAEEETEAVLELSASKRDMVMRLVEAARTRDRARLRDVIAEALDKAGL